MKKNLSAGNKTEGWLNMKRFMKTEPWEMTRTRGKFRYIFYHGVLGFGLSMFLFNAVLVPTLRGSHSFWVTFLIVLFLFFPVFCFWFGFIQRCFIKQYVKSIFWLVCYFIALAYLYLVNGSDVELPPDYSLVIGIVICCTGGALWGTWVWFNSERSHRKRLKK